MVMKNICDQSIREKLAQAATVSQQKLFPPIHIAATVYINHCWNCGCIIDSRVCRRSQTPGMGYHCNTCGKDLTEWKGKCYGR